MLGFIVQNLVAWRHGDRDLSTAEVRPKIDVRQRMSGTVRV